MQEMLENALSLFENEKYEEAVEQLITIYNSGYEKEKIFQFLYDCFIMPNEQEFRKNYESVRADFTQLMYEETLLQFIPVSDTKFYIYKSDTKEFCGFIELPSEKENEHYRTLDIDITSLLCCDVWDIRKILNVVKEKRYGSVYIVSEGIEPYLASFFKLPQWADIYFQNVLFVKSFSLLCTFFRENEEIYLPTAVLSKDFDKYQSEIHAIHRERIACKSKKCKPLMSLCIPSYNRGIDAWNNVCHLCNLPLDSEIEIVVCDNGSYLEKEWYDKIRDLNDSRVVYYRAEENKGYAENICKAFELAKGDYVLYISDQDKLIEGSLEPFLTYLLNHNIGAAYERIIGKEGCHYDASIHDEGSAAAIKCALGLNYITGTCVNKKLVCEIGYSNFVRENIGNRYVDLYAHKVFAMLGTLYGKMCLYDGFLWEQDAFKHKRTEEEEKQGGFGTGLLSYMTFEERGRQLRECLNLVSKFNEIGRNVFVDVMMNKLLHYLYLINLPYCFYREEYAKRMGYDELMNGAWVECNEVLELYRDKLNEAEYNNCLAHIKTAMQSVREEFSEYVNAKE